MEFDNSFTVPLPPDETWMLLRDIERVAPCMPGATLTETVGADAYKGEVSVRLGPVSLTFKGQANFEAIDDAARTARVKADGKDSKGRGGANATVDFTVEAGAQGSVVQIHTNLMLSGPVAQYGRGVGMVKALADQLIGQFADALKAELAATSKGEEELVEAASQVELTPDLVSTQRMTTSAVKPVAGISLLLNTVWAVVLKIFRKPE